MLKNLRRVFVRSNRDLSVIVFSLFFSWLLAFPFEGKILYGLLEYHRLTPQSYIFAAIAAHFLGLLLGGFYVRLMVTAKRLILFTIIFCAFSSVFFFLPPSLLWMVILILASLLAGGCVAAWGFYFKNCTPPNQRIKTIADGLIFSNLFMILLNILAIHISPHAGLGFLFLILGIAFFFAMQLPSKTSPREPWSEEDKEEISKTGPLTLLCLFIVVITINSGLMYQVQDPAFAHLKNLTSWYWALPYIAAILIVRNLPRKANRGYLLYVAIAMIGFSYLFFLLLGRSWVDYLVVNTLMLGACGIYDLFWWSILGSMLEFDHNPAKILGLGLAANVFGVLLGGMMGAGIIQRSQQSYSSSLLALSVVCVSLVLLPLLHNRLLLLLEDHAYLTLGAKSAVLDPPPQDYSLGIVEKFTPREAEIANLLIRGKTYRLIAQELHVSENTVKTHVKNIYAKAGVQNKMGLINVMLKIPIPPA